MNKRNGFVIAALVHLILLGVLFLLVVVGSMDYVRTETMEFLDAAFLRGFMITGGIAFLSGVLLFFAVRRVCRSASPEKKTKNVVALCFSATAMISFYAFIALLFGVNKDELTVVYLALAFLWLASTIVSSVMLLISAKKRDGYSAGMAGE